ncbi:MAG: FlgD immunoglobulin-like domain containing protein, partial [Ignavibacteriaceae bacterium]
SWANSVSEGGKVIAGYGDSDGSGWDSYQGFIWTDSGGMKPVGNLDGSVRSMAFSVSANGSVIVGDGGPEAFRWIQENGPEGLGILPNRTNSRAVDVSADGSVIIGQSYTLPAWNDEDGFIWTQSGGMRGMSSLTGGRYCMLLSISPDGSVIGGTTQSSSAYPAFFFTEDKGMVIIGHLPGKNTTHPTDMTPFGSTIIGGSYSGPAGGEAFIWDSTNGIRSLKTVLQADYELNLDNWILMNATGITPDGNIIVGQAKNSNGEMEAFRVILDTLLTHIEESQTPVKDFDLGQNYPNPFNPSTTINYRLSQSSNVKLKIYDSLGQEIKTLVNSFQNTGEYSIVWDGNDDSNNTVSSGVYFYSIKTDEMTGQKKMILIR